MSLLARILLERGRGRLALALAVAAILLSGPSGGLMSHGHAAEQSREFIEGLRNLGYYDTAIEYLELAADNPLVAPEFKETLDYEAGVTLTTAAQATRSMAAKEKHLAEARAKFEKFVAEHPEHPSVVSAKRLLAKLLVVRGQIFVDKALRPDTEATERTNLMAQARPLFQSGEKVFTDLRSHILRHSTAGRPVVNNDQDRKKHPVSTKNLIRRPVRGVSGCARTAATSFRANSLLTLTGSRREVSGSLPQRTPTGHGCNDKLPG